MTIFDILGDIFRNKTGKLIENSDFSEALQSPYILQRWISMYSTQNAYLVSETTNKLCSGLMEDKELWYKLYLTIIDKQSKYTKTKYIKRTKNVVKEEHNTILTKLSNVYEISKKEVESNMKLLETLNEGAN